MSYFPFLLAWLHVQSSSCSLSPLPLLLFGSFFYGFSFSLLHPLFSWFPLLSPLLCFVELANIMAVSLNYCCTCDRNSGCWLQYVGHWRLLNMHVTVTIVQTSHLFLCVFRVGSPSFLVRGYGVRSEISNNLTIGSYLNSIQVDLDLSFGVVVNPFEDIASFHVFLD
jgi:hypothetical protein